MKLERDEMRGIFLESLSKEISRAYLMAAIGMNETMINQAMDRAYPKYEQNFQLSTSKNVDYKTTVEKLKNDTENSRYSIRSRDQILEAVFHKLRVQYDTSINPNEPKKESFKDKSSEQVLQMLREQNDVDFRELSEKRSQKIIVLDEDDYRAAKVRERLEIIKIAAINTFLREAGNVVAETRVSNPSLIEENRKEGREKITTIKNDLQRALEKTKADESKNDDNSFLGKATSLNNKITDISIVGRQTLPNISIYVKAVTPQIKQYADHLNAGIKNSELTMDERKVLVSQLERAIEVLKEKRSIIDSSTISGIESYREKDDYQKFCGLIDQLEVCKNEYSARLNQEVSEKSVQAVAAAPEKPKSNLSSRKPVQRQSSLTDDQFAEAVTKAEKKEASQTDSQSVEAVTKSETNEASQAKAEPVQRDSVRRPPSWTNRSDQQTAKLATQNDATENNDYNQDVGLASSLSSTSKN